jgi:hypothetical protein
MRLQMRLASLLAFALLCPPRTAAAQGASGWRADPEVARRATGRQPAFNFEEARVPPYTLPDLLSGNGDRRHAQPRAREAWMRRHRAEILDLFREHVYGRSPGRP